MSEIRNGSVPIKSSICRSTAAIDKDDNYVSLIFDAG